MHHKAAIYCLMSNLFFISVMNSSVLTTVTLLPGTASAARSFVITPPSIVSIQARLRFLANPDSSSMPSITPRFESAPTGEYQRYGV